jgi:hypothetical protein
MWDLIGPTGGERQAVRADSSDRYQHLSIPDFLDTIAGPGNWIYDHDADLYVALAVDAHDRPGLAYVLVRPDRSMTGVYLPPTKIN